MNEQLDLFPNPEIDENGNLLNEYGEPEPEDLDEVQEIHYRDLLEEHFQKTLSP
jgi:hypothetical protein